jgi:hypothetical protein
MISVINLLGYKNCIKVSYIKTPDNKLKRYIDYDIPLPSPPKKKKLTNRYTEDILNELRRHINFN